MNNINDDITVDGWLALCIAILCGCPQQEAFRRLNNPFSRRKWSEDDFLEIEYLRNSGVIWDDICEMMNINKNTALKQWQRWKNGQVKLK